MQSESSSPNMNIATATQRSAPPSSDVHSMSMHYGDENLVHADVKPTVESVDMAVQQWTPSKQLLLSPTKMLPSTPTGIKTEVCTFANLFCKVSQLNLDYCKYLNVLHCVGPLIHLSNNSNKSSTTVKNSKISTQ